uniref:Uncharacterized protein n=1 Tax=Anopheles farauti TaxID=69004 RepID=A0A182QYQ0_9DIPT
MAPLLICCRTTAPAIDEAEDEDDEGVSAKATVAEEGEVNVEVAEEEEVDEEEEEEEEEGEEEEEVEEVMQDEDGADGMAVKIVLACAGLMVAVDRFANEIFERSLNVNCWLSGRTRANWN